MKRRLGCTLAGVLLSIHFLLLGWGIYSPSSVRSEEALLASGVSQYEHLSFELYQVTPPLTKWIAAYPFKDSSFEKKVWWRRGRASHERNEFAVGAALVRASSDYASLLVAARLWLAVPFRLVGLVAVSLFAYKLYGQTSALFALALSAFSPYILGHGVTVFSDVPAAMLACTACLLFLVWLQAPDTANAIVAGVALGLAELCKFTLLVLYPLFVVIWVVYQYSHWRSVAWRKRVQLICRQFGQFVILITVSVFIINCGYLCKGTFTPLGEFRFQTMALTGYDSLEDVPADGASRFAGTWLGSLPVPLPADMIQGIDTQRLDFERGIPSYMRGRWADHGWWYYYLYALGVKVPLGMWILVLMAVGVTIFGRGFNAPWRDEMVVLAPGLVILVFVSSQTGFSANSRYVIPALPFLFIWTSKVARVFSVRSFMRGRPAFAATVVAALTWSVGSSLWVFPHSLSYFNELAGGPKGGGEHLLGSNIDWGQDLYYLKTWLDKHPEVNLDGLACGGSYPATLAGLPETHDPPVGHKFESTRYDLTDPLDQRGPERGWYALSTNYLHSREREYRYFLQFETVAMAGYSIHIYHITLEDANRVRRELGLPE